MLVEKSLAWELVCVCVCVCILSGLFVFHTQLSHLEGSALWIFLIVKMLGSTELLGFKTTLGYLRV